MNSRTFFTLAILLALASSTVACQGAVPSIIQTSAGDTSRRTITVAGEGMVIAKPDLAVLSLAVDIFSPTLPDSMQQNSVKTADVIAKLKSLGIADKDIQTSGLEVTIGRIPDSTTITRYNVSNLVIVVIRDLNKITDIIDQSVKIGANNVLSLYFTIENSAKQEAEARAKAVADAQARADDIAKLNGLQRGDVITFSQESVPTAYPLGGHSSAKSLGASAGPPTEWGSLEITVRVQITYAVI